MLVAAIYLLLAQPSPPLPQAVPVQQSRSQPSRFEDLFTDWSAAGQDALRAERERGVGLWDQPEPQARALGDRVGEMVAMGDCDGGERTAREAGDFALLRAVQDHCRRQAAGVLAGSTDAPPQP